jgi:hypothetical protein
MNIALTLSQGHKAMLVYDQPFPFIPSWIESSADGRGVRIIGEGGEEFTADISDSQFLSKLEPLQDIMLVRMQDRRPVECFTVSFINQNYEDGDV